MVTNSMTLQREVASTDMTKTDEAPCRFSANDYQFVYHNSNLLYINLAPESNKTSLLLRETDGSEANTMVGADAVTVPLSDGPSLPIILTFSHVAYHS